jgi:iron complex outermembrane receptor protein
MNRTHASPLVLFAALAASLGTPVRAAEDPALMREVVVSEHQAPSITVPSVSQARREINRTPGGVTVIDAEQIREGRVSTFADSLGTAAGVYVQPRFGAEETRLSIRGSGIQRTFHLRGIKVMQDGVPLTLADGGGDFQSLEPLATRYIEVYRGANALQYGAATLGGAINYISPTGYDAAPLTLRGEVGSFGYLRSQIAVAGEKNGFDGYASLSTFDQDGFRRHAHQNVQRIVANGGMRISPDLETRLYFGYFDGDSELPGNLCKSQLRRDPRQNNLLNTGCTAPNPNNIVATDQKRDVDLYRVANKTVYRFGEARLELFGYYSDKQLFHPIFNVISEDNQDVGLSARLVSDAKLAGLPNRVIFGIAPARGRTDQDRFSNDVTRGRSVRTNTLEQESTTVEAYVEDQLTIVPRWTIVLGTQYTHAKRENIDRFFGAQVGAQAIAAGAQTANESFRVSYSGWSPKLGLRHDWSDSVQFFANVSRSYEPPSLGELTGGLRPVINKAQRGTTFEVGSRGGSAELGWDLALYHSRIRDELLARNIPDPINPANQISVTANAPKTIHQGLELAANGAFLKSAAGIADWRGALLINDFKFDGDAQFGDNTLPGIPKSFFRGEVGYRFAGMPGGPLRIGANLEWSPQDYPVDMANTLFADSHAIWGLRVQQTIGKSLSWFIDGRNLSDRKYASATGVIQNAGGLDSAQFLPGDGRSVFAGLEWRL